MSAFMLNYKIAKRAKKDGRFYLYISINCLTDDTWVCQTLLRNMRRMNAFAFYKSAEKGFGTWLRREEEGGRKKSIRKKD